MRILIHTLALLMMVTTAIGAPAKKGAKAKKDIPPPKQLAPGQPDIFLLEPRGVQRGIATEVKIVGTNLQSQGELKLSDPKLTAEFVRMDETTTNSTWIKVTPASDLSRGAYEVSVKNEKGESSKLKLYVDDLVQFQESKTNDRPVLKLPATFWGTLNPAGDTDNVYFNAKTGETIVFDVSARSIDSKANPSLTLFDEKGVLLASNTGFDGGDPLLHFKIPASGRYRVSVSDNMAAGSKDHFYRLSMGTFAEVVGCFPLSVPANQESEVELIGYNLPAASKARVKAGMNGEVEVPVNPEKFRNRKTIKVMVGSGSEMVESEPNDTAQQAMKVAAPVVVNGRIWNPAASSDSDIYRFEAKKGQRWIIETMAVQRSSPADTRIEILDIEGKPVERLVLQAVRNSAINFRPMDSNAQNVRLDNYEEMELNNYYYSQGDVCRLFRMPQGPDSDMLMFASNGKRRAYFDTTATTHALDEQGYIVEPHAPGEKLENNGLPVFPIYFENDDDGERRIGTDSKVHFNPAKDGTYLVRVTESRGFSGDRYAYRLILREAKPDFKVTLNGANPTVPAGSGQSFSVNIDRTDGFDDAVRVDISGLPPGFTVSTPLVIEAGHAEAKGTINAAWDAVQPAETNSPVTKVTATATIDRKEVVREVNNFGQINLGEKPKLWVMLQPTAGSDSTNTNPVAVSEPLELTIVPGKSIPAWLKVKRNGHEDLITFTVDNLPHGIIVDNIGLNGVLIPKGENERQIFFTSEKWVQETDRYCYAIENQAGRQTSVPVLLHVRKKTAATSAKAK